MVFFRLQYDRGWYALRDSVIKNVMKQTGKKLSELAEEVITLPTKHL